MARVPDSARIGSEGRGRSGSESPLTGPDATQQVPIPPITGTYTMHERYVLQTDVVDVSGEEAAGAVEDGQDRAKVIDLR